MKTRTKGPAKSSTEETKSANNSISKKQLGPTASNPPHLFIIPENTSSAARIVTLENPRYETETRYLVCPERGFYEFIKVSEPKIIPRSWLLSTQDGTGTLGEVESLADLGVKEKDGDISKGYVTRSANLFVATKVDPLFLILPAVAPKPTSKGSEPEKKLYLSAEDYIDRVGAASSQLRTMLKIDAVRTVLESRMGVVCDNVDAGDEMMYRVNEKKLLKELLSKAQNMSRDGLPESMEERFVTKALEVPTLSIQRNQSLIGDSVKEDEDPATEESETVTPATESSNSQISTSTVATSITEPSTAATKCYSDTAIEAVVERAKPTISAPEGVADLLRLRTAFSFILSTYLPPHLTTSLKALLSSPEISAIDFAPLDTHLAHLVKLRQDAIAVRSLGDMSRKRGLEDDEEDETRAEKKRKKEEEDKRKKAGESRAVKNLKKVNTAGMKKMSDFFKKKT